MANAAYQSGFNTHNHLALFELIWSVKQVALRVARPQSRRLAPPHPIYPDRYRPSGIGDNTEKKRRPGNNFRRVDDGQPPKFHSIPPLMRKRKPDFDANDNQITLASDGSFGQLAKTPANSRAKRQKVSKKNSKNRANEGHLIGRPPLSHTNMSTLDSGRVNIKAEVAPPDQQPQASLNIRHRSTGPAIKSLSFRPMPRVVTSAPKPPHGQIVKQLLLVKTKLDDAKKSMNNCQAAMSAMFEDHRSKFDNDEIVAIFTKLSSCMNKVYDGGRDGMIEAERAVKWIHDDKTGSL